MLQLLQYLGFPFETGNRIWFNAGGIARHELQGYKGTIRVTRLIDHAHGASTQSAENGKRAYRLSHQRIGHGVLPSGS